MTFKCGHEGVIPNNMGRGAARVKRLAEYFGRRCPECARASYRKNLESCQWSAGVPQYTPDEINEKVQVYTLGRY